LLAERLDLSDVGEGGDRLNDESDSRGPASQAENATARWYEGAGYEVLSRNWVCRQGEIDLVLRRGREIIFCAVQARSSDALGDPLEAVTREKRQRLRFLAGRWLEEETRARPSGIRFDVASVMNSEVEVLEGAF
jgi:putative endonuclease